MNDKNFDKYITNALEEETYPVSESAWDKVSKNLTPKRRSIPLWYKIAAVLVVGVGLSIVYVQYHSKALRQTPISIENSPVYIPETTTELVVTPIKPIESKNQKVQKNLADKTIDYPIVNITPLETINEHSIAHQSNVEPLNHPAQKTTKSINPVDETPVLVITIPKDTYQVSISSADLLQNIETELELERQPTIKEKIFTEIKHQVNERFALANK